MTCTHERTKTTTAWRAYEPRSSGIAQAKLIREERCLDCGQSWVSATHGIRATRERPQTLAVRLDPLRHRAEERGVLRDLVECAEPDGDDMVARAGAWRARHEGKLGGATLETLLRQLMEDGLLTIETSRTQKQAGKITSVCWPRDQYASVSRELGVEPEIPSDARAELEHALARFGTQDALAGLTAFWQDQLHQLHQGIASIHDSSGEQLLTSRAPRYPRIVRATIKIAENHAGRSLILFDELGIQVTGNTKDLRADRPILRAICGGSLAGYGIIEPSELIEIAGPVRFYGSGFDLASSIAPFGLPAEVIDAMRIETPALRLVVIENPTSFHYALRAEAFSGDVRLLADGRLSHAQQRLVSRLCAGGITEVVAWCDIDPVGIMIADDVRAAAGVTRFSTALMDPKAFERAPVRRKLQGQNLRYSKTLSAKTAWYSSVVGIFEKTGEWVEQEALHGLFSEERG